MRKYISGKDSLIKNEVDRRQFLKTASVAGMAGVSAVTLGSIAPAVAQVRGGHVKVGMAGGQTGDALDTTNLVSSHQQAIIVSIHEYLTETDAAQNLQPRLAESWEPKDGGTRWIFKLRSGGSFSNGKSITAEDVVATVNYHRHEDSKSSLKVQLDQISEVTADGPNVVEFKLQAPNSDFPYLTADYRMAILPPADGGSVLNDGTVSGGSYFLESFDPGVRAILKRNPNYWRKDVGFFDSVELLAIRDPHARQTALISGAIDVMERCDLLTVDALRNLESVRVLSIRGKQHFTYPMRTDTAPFDNNDVRMAVKLSLDRDQFLKKVMRGYGSVGNDHPISPAYRYYDESIPQRVYDPEKAKWHLKQAGYDNLTINMRVSDAAFTGAVDGAVLFAESSKKSGIKMNIERAPKDGYWSEVWMNAPLCACVWYGRPVADETFSIGYASSAAWNDTFWKNDRFDELLLQARAELDTNLRAEMYGELQRIVRDDGGQIVPGFADWVDAISSKIATPSKISGANQLDGFRFAERWSLKA